MTNAKAFEQLWKTAIGPSLISSFTPKELTATQRMILARSRIWGDVIGGNVKTGHKWARKAWPHEGMHRYFEAGISEYHFPFELPNEDSDEDNNDIDTYREIRNSRKGKILVKAPKRALKDIPKYKAKRYLFTEKIRKEQQIKSGLGKQKKIGP